MDSTTLATPQVDPRDKKKFYFADASQRSALIAAARFLFNFVMKALPKEVCNVYAEMPKGFELQV